MTPQRKKRLLRVVLALAATFGVLQLWRPDRTNPSIDQAHTLSATVKVPADIAQTLADTCADCHSHATNWPWYSNLAPASWLVADDVHRGREHLNLSDFGSEEKHDQTGLLLSAARQVERGEMPPGGYQFMHSAAGLTAARRARLAGWFRETAAHLAEDDAQSSATAPAPESRHHHDHEHDHK